MAVNVRVEAKRLNVLTLVRIFKRACNEAGVMHEFKEHEFFVRKTDKKRRKKMIKRRGALEAEANKLEPNKKKFDN